MRRVAGYQLLAFTGCLVASAVFLPLRATAQTTEIPGVQVTAALPGTIHQAATFAVTFELTNTGAASLTDVMVAPMNACDPASTGGVVEFEEIAGNGDDVFEPSEVWSYVASQCVDGADDLVSVDVSVFDGVDTLAAGYSFPYAPVSPVQADSIGEVAADECLLNSFDIPVQVVTNTPFINAGTFLELAVPLEGGGFESIVRTELAEFRHISGDADGTFDPGEELLAVFFFGSIAQCAEVPDPPLVLLLSMQGTSVPSGATWCFGTESCADPAVVVGTIIELVAAVDETSTTTSPTLPFTGPSPGSFSLVALATLAIGVLLLAASRQSRRDRRR